MTEQKACDFPEDIDHGYCSYRRPGKDGPTCTLPKGHYCQFNPPRMHDTGTVGKILGLNYFGSDFPPEEFHQRGTMTTGSTGYHKASRNMNPADGGDDGNRG